jgi:hypothetical protein
MTANEFLQAIAPLLQDFEVKIREDERKRCVERVKSAAGKGSTPVALYVMNAMWVTDAIAAINSGGCDVQ